MPQPEARGPKQVWSFVITHIPTCIRNCWQYLYMQFDI